MGVPKPGVVALPSSDKGAGFGACVNFPFSVVRKGEVLNTGDIVRMNSSSDAVRLCFRSCGYCWDKQMDGMLGKEFPILEMTSKGIVALPSPDGSQNGKWYFPVSVVKKVSGEHEDVVRRDRDCQAPSPQ